MTTIILKFQEILDKIDNGEIIPQPKFEFEGGLPPFCGLNIYKAEGWTFCVFDDCNAWDYFEYVIDPDGKKTEFPTGKWEDLSDFEKLVQSWGPKSARQWGYDYD